MKLLNYQSKPTRIFFLILILICAVWSVPAVDRLDITFSGTGFRLTDFTGSDFNQGKAVLVRPNGKSIVAGAVECSDGITRCFGLARYLSTGELDTTLNGKGFVRTLIYDGSESAAVAVLPDASIFVAGSALYNGQTVFAVAKYTSTGLLDPSFAGDGIQIANFGSTADSRAVAIAVQPADGKIIVAGEIAYAAPNGYDFALIRYNPDGSRDLTFDSDGRVTVDFGSVALPSQDHATSMVLQSDGKILIAGNVNNDFAVARFNMDGSPDTTFGSGGRVRFSDGAVQSIALQADGKIVGGGYSLFSAQYSSSMVFRLNTDGTFDSTFNGNGIKQFSPDGNSSRVNAVAVTINGGIFTAGSNYFADGDVSRFVVSCFASNGQFDSAFGDGGVQTNIFNGNIRNEANGLFFQPDNRLIVTGYSGTDTINTFATARYLTAGF